MPDIVKAESEAAATEVVLIEDDAPFRLSVRRSLELEGHVVHAFGDAESALTRIPSLDPSLVLVDLKLPGNDGMFVLGQLRITLPDVPVVLMTGHGDIPTAIQAIRAGAYDFLEKPFNREQLLAVVLRGRDQYRLVSENISLKKRLAASAGIDHILRGQVPAMRELRDLVLRLAPTPVDILLRGEAGTGKELVARCLHDYGQRGGSFMIVNCSSAPESSFELELFGSGDPSAGGGNNTPSLARFAGPGGTTLFLDEVEAMPLHMQARLLRVLQERDREQAGAGTRDEGHIRVVAAARENLHELAQRGQFRQDLLYRLSVASIQIPPLRDRITDIPLLFQAFLQEASLRYQLPVPAVTGEDHQALLAHKWPGNVRELKATAERLTLSLPMFAASSDEAATPRSFDESVAMIERSLLEAALRRHDGSVKAACAELALPPATLYRKLKAFGLDPADFRSGPDK